MLRLTSLQEFDGIDLEGRVIRNFSRMYESYFEERALIPKGRLHELRFEDLDTEPVEQMRKVYDGLALTGFDSIAPNLSQYAESVKEHKKNQFTDISSSQKRAIQESWSRAIDEWAYHSV